MDSNSSQILIESFLASIAMLGVAVFMILKWRDTVATPENRIGSYDWGSYQSTESEKRPGDSNKPKHA